MLSRNLSHKAECILWPSHSTNIECHKDNLSIWFQVPGLTGPHTPTNSLSISSCFFILCSVIHDRIFQMEKHHHKECFEFYIGNTTIDFICNVCNSHPLFISYLTYLTYLISTSYLLLPSIFIRFFWFYHSDRCLDPDFGEVTWCQKQWMIKNRFLEFF